MSEYESLVQKKESLATALATQRHELFILIAKRQQLFEKRNPLLEEWRTLATRLRSIKRDLDQTTEVKQLLKQRRTTYNQEAKQLLDEFHKKCREEQEARKKLNIRSLAAIQKSIEQMEARIETEGLPFEREKQLTEKLKVLQRKVAAAAGVQRMHDEIQQLKKRIGDTRKNADSQHEQLYDRIATDHEEFGQLKDVAAKMNALRPTLDAATVELNAVKDAIAMRKQQLDTAAREMRETTERIVELRKHESLTRKQREQQLIQEKTKTVEEKFRTGKKLTNQDLIVLQGSMKWRQEPAEQTTGERTIKKPEQPQKD